MLLRILLLLWLIFPGYTIAEAEKNIFYYTIAGRTPPVFLLRITHIPVAKLSAEVFITPWLSSALFYSSIRAFGFLPTGVIEKVGAGIKLYPLIATKVITTSQDRMRYFTYSTYFHVSFRSHRRNTFALWEPGESALFVQEDQLVWEQMVGIVGGPGVFLAYGGKKVGVSFEVQLDVGIMWGKKYTLQEAVVESDFTSTRYINQSVRSGSFSYINIGGTYVALYIALGGKQQGVN